MREYIYIIPAALLAISAHEFSHGYVSNKLGDPTPENNGRLTLNPLAHLDVWGVLCMIVFRMGWAKPVPINPYYYKDRKKGIILVSLAGPLMNYLLTFVGLLLYGVCYKYNWSIGIWFYYFAIINVGLGTFNLIPIPPLDGSNVLGELAPQVQTFYYKIKGYAPLILVGCLYLGILQRPMNLINDFVVQNFWKIIQNLLRIGVYTSGNFI